jgi:hypothetical protein
MEAMTQEFMLHSRPHVKIRSTREGSDEDNKSIQVNHGQTRDPPQKPNSGGLQCNKTNHGITNDSHQKKKSDGSKFNPIFTSGPQQKQKSD